MSFTESFSKPSSVPENKKENRSEAHTHSYIFRSMNEDTRQAAIVCCEEALETLMKGKLSLKSWLKFYRYHILEKDYAFGQKDDLSEVELGINPKINK